MSASGTTGAAQAQLWTVNQLAGVGPERAGLLEKLGIRTIRDLLLHRPRRYEDRRQVQSIHGLKEGETALVRGQIIAMGIKRYSKGRKSVFELVLDDGTGRLHARWWNLPYMQQYFEQGQEVVAYGKVQSLRPRGMDHPETEVIGGDNARTEEARGDEASIHLHRIVPIYPLTEGLSQRWLRALIWRTLESRGGEILSEPWPPEWTPDLPAHAAAVRRLHRPGEMDETEGARKRLALEEFVAIQIGLQTRRRKLLEKSQGRPCPGDNRLIKPFLSQLGFELTEAQTKVLREIRKDLGSGAPMRRLLQGDVGSGKTVVAACAALMVLESGYSVIFMAPTEILAGQHFQTLRRWLDPLQVPTALRTGSQRIEAEIQPAGTIARERGLTVGTHALIENAFSVENLGLVIIDEQHKFGVIQREKLVRKGAYPHLLVMSATPIPRTLGLTLYGDLDLSVIDQPPQGRAGVKTYLRSPEKLPQVWEFTRSQLAQGRQVYVICPRVEESDQGELKAVTKEWEGLKKEFPNYRVGLIHGRVPTEERERTMMDFRSNAVQVLLATSIIEVGVDVPNATVMVVENAELFGLAQLHQLRGRIGRGAHASYCILLTGKKSIEAAQRLKILSETSDGFQIAEADLKLRGPGDFLGQEQSGVPGLRFADFVLDYELARRARELAGKVLDEVGKMEGGGGGQ